MVQINWTLRSKNDLEVIKDYISIDSKKYAHIQVFRIVQRVKVLQRQSRIGRIVPEFDEVSLRELIEGNYRIVYKIRSKTRIDILTIHHTARDILKLDL